MNAERFWDKVDRSGGDEACWPWTGAATMAGYGKISDGGRLRPATHVSLELAGTAVPAGCLVRHACDNPPCVNPAHLVPGTQHDNMRDAQKRGRTASGERHGRRRLTEDDVVWMRHERAAGARLTSLALRYGVSEAEVSLICRGIKWLAAGGPRVPKDPRFM